MNAYPENFAKQVASALGLNPDHSGTKRLAADLAKPEQPWPDHVAKPMCREASMRRQMGLALAEDAGRLAAWVKDERIDEAWSEAAWLLVQAARCAGYAEGVRYCIKVADALNGLTTPELLWAMRCETDHVHWEVAAERIRRARTA